MDTLQVIVFGNYGDSRILTLTFCPERPDEKLDYHSSVCHHIKMRLEARRLCPDGPIQLKRAWSDFDHIDDVLLTLKGLKGTIKLYMDHPLVNYFYNEEYIDVYEHDGMDTLQVIVFGNYGDSKILTLTFCPEKPDEKLDYHSSVCHHIKMRLEARRLCPDGPIQLKREWCDLDHIDDVLLTLKGLKGTINLYMDHPPVDYFYNEEYIDVYEHDGTSLEEDTQEDLEQALAVRVLNDQSELINNMVKRLDRMAAKEELSESATATLPQVGFSAETVKKMVKTLNKDFPFLERKVSDLSEAVDGIAELTKLERRGFCYRIRDLEQERQLYSEAIHDAQFKIKKVVEDMGKSEDRNERLRTKVEDMEIRMEEMEKKFEKTLEGYEIRIETLLKYNTTLQERIENMEAAAKRPRHFRIAAKKMATGEAETIDPAIDQFGNEKKKSFLRDHLNQMGVSRNPITTSTNVSTTNYHLKNLQEMYMIHNIQTDAVKLLNEDEDLSYSKTSSTAVEGSEPCNTKKLTKISKPLLTQRNQQKFKKLNPKEKKKAAVALLADLKLLQTKIKRFCQLEIESNNGVTAVDQEDRDDVESVVTALEPEDRDDLESVATAIEQDDLEDVESVMTAVEHEDLEDVESVMTAVEPEDEDFSDAESFEIVE